MAGAFTNQPRSTPINNQQVANQLGNGNFTQFNQGMMQPGMGGGMGYGAPGMGGGMGGGMGPGGNIYPLGGGMAHTTIYAVVESGQPIIMNPKTGEPYPPGYIPTIQDPNTWEQWQPGQSWAETMELANSEFSEGMRQAQETLLRPGEEAAAESAQGFLQDLSKAANKWSGETAQNVYGKDNKTLKDIQQKGAEASRQAISQAPKIAQQAVRQAPQAAQRVGQAAIQSANQVSNEASKFFMGGGSARPSQGEARSALTSVAGDRPVFSSGRRN